MGRLLHFEFVWRGIYKRKKTQQSSVSKWSPFSSKYKYVVSNKSMPSSRIKGMTTLNLNKESECQSKSRKTHLPDFDFFFKGGDMLPATPSIPSPRAGNSTH